MSIPDIWKTAWDRYSVVQQPRATLGVYHGGWWMFTYWDSPCMGLRADEWYAPIVNLGNAVIHTAGAGLLSLWAPVFAHNVVPCFTQCGLDAAR